ncbi:hypothetical protein SS50377_25647 [Spironucleus salmonicida]|uniref:Dynein regulatory complex protein 10 n=1 Tax=Spironucleus salmonicida TaxID=348837 RepID=V6LYV3_9EUKA|nr:hypothetical protein SS50377_25647 [Spironucleus salmonicida]|eukprot:EST49453.1 hypothetical protein SS50377_10201 [Spironucleus salmonicida]
MNKLIAVEACRCLSVIQDMIDTLEQLQLVTPSLFGTVDIESVFGQRLSDLLREYSRKRLALESALAEQATVRAGGFKSRLKSLEKKIVNCTKEYKLEVEKLTMEFSVSREFYSKLVSNGVNVQQLLPQQQIQIGGGGGKSMASGSVAQEQQQSIGQAGAVQQYSSIQDLIHILKNMHNVVKLNMNTSVQQEQNRKQLISQLTQSERQQQNTHASLLKEFDLLFNQNKQQESSLNDQISSVNNQLNLNATNADSTANKLLQQASTAETDDATNFTQQIEQIKASMNELGRKLTDLSKKQKEQSSQVNRDKRRAFVNIRDNIHKFDQNAKKLDEDIFRLKHEIRLSDTRISQLDEIIAEYKKDKTYRDSLGDQAEKKKERWEMFWELAPECYIERED